MKTFSLSQIKATLKKQQSKTVEQIEQERRNSIREQLKDETLGYHTREIYENYLASN